MKTTPQDHYCPPIDTVAQKRLNIWFTISAATLVAVSCWGAFGSLL